MLRLLFGLAIALSAAITVPLRQASAATITVDRTDDTAAASVCTAAANDCSLRGAIAFANATSGTVISVPAGTYVLTVDELKVGTAAGNNTTITGAGAATTIIQQTVANRRVIDVNPNVLANVVVNISGVTITGGNNPSDNFGGGGIIGGGPGNALTLSNCIIDGNTDAASATPKGGGIEFAGGGVLTIDNCVISNNTAGSSASNLGVGGGVDFQLLNNAGAAGQGGLSITNSTFTGNKAGLSNSGAGGAVRVAATTTQVPSILNISNNTFTSNQANAATNGLGGAISSVSSHTITARFNRIVGNTATGGATGMYQTTASTGSINATQNWWGCNAGPGNAGCDSIGGVTANITTAPRLVLTHTASPNSILVNQGSTLTASFLTDSAGGAVTLANISRLIGLPISFGGPVLGTVSGAQTTIQANGTATASFTATGQGAASANATVDNVTATASISINKANTATSISADSPDPSVVGQAYTVNYSVSSFTGSSPTAPTGNVTVTDGTNTCIGTVAAGQCSLTSTTPGAKTLTATYAGDANFNGSTSPGVPHAVNLANTTTTITSDSPDPSTVGQNVTVQYTVVATAPGAGTPTGNVLVSDGVDSCSATVAAGQCVITLNTPGTRALTATYAGDANFNGSTSAGATHTVTDGIPPSVTVNQAAGQADPTSTSPINFTVVFNEPVTGFETGDVSLGGTAGATAATVSGGPSTFNVAVNGMTASGTVTASIPAGVAVDGSGNPNTASTSTDDTVTYVLVASVAPTITTQPTNQSACVGGTVSFFADASGTPTPTVQWQVSADNGATWSDLSGATATTLSFTVQAGDSGRQYQAVFTNSAGTATSNAATLTVNMAPQVTTQPAAQTVAAGQSASFNSAASGSPAPTVQWFVSADNGASWNGISGATANALSFTAQASDNGKLYRAVFSNLCAIVNSNAVTLTVLAPVAIVITPNMLPTGTKGSTYSQGLTASNGQAPYTFSIVNGALPAGLSLSSAGVIAGTPSAVGTFTFTVQAADTNTNVGTQTYTLNVYYEFTGFLPLLVNPPTLNQWTAGVPMPFVFKIKNNGGMNILAANSPASQLINCSAPFGPIGNVVPASPNPLFDLQYQSSTTYYIYTWKTNRQWKGTCRQFILTLNDGTVRAAYVRFR
jgi:hypothetical protein